MKYDDRIEELKEKLYAGILCDVLDQKGYRNQALSDAIHGLNDDTVKHFTNWDAELARDGKGWLQLYLPARSACVLRKANE